MVSVPTIRALSAADAPRLADLATAYRRAMSGPAEATTPGQAAALIERALRAPDLLLLGADCGGALAGFALAFELPEIISGGRAGQLDDLFVMPEARGSGLARAPDPPADRDRHRARLDPSALARAAGQCDSNPPVSVDRRPCALGQFPDRPEPLC